VAKPTKKELDRIQNYVFVYHIVIVGFNETGLKLAEFYLEQGQDVVVIDLNWKLHPTLMSCYKGTKPISHRSAQFANKLWQSLQRGHAIVPASSHPGVCRPPATLFGFHISIEAVGVAMPGHQRELGFRAFPTLGPSIVGYSRTRVLGASFGPCNHDHHGLINDRQGLQVYLSLLSFCSWLAVQNMCPST